MVGSVVVSFAGSVIDAAGAGHDVEFEVAAAFGPLVVLFGQDCADGLLRQYFSKGTDLSLHGEAELCRVEDLLNNRPRRILDWQTPVEGVRKSTGIVKVDLLLQRPLETAPNIDNQHHKSGGSPPGSSPSTGPASEGLLAV